MHSNPSAPLAFLSRLPYEPARIRAAAIYCSDGRVGEQFDDFLHHGLKLPRYDRVALPGGPGLLRPLARVGRFPLPHGRGSENAVAVPGETACWRARLGKARLPLPDP